MGVDQHLWAKSYIYRFWIPYMACLKFMGVVKSLFLLCLMAKPQMFPMIPEAALFSWQSMIW